MNLDSLFTVVALFAAVYAILPSARRMSIYFYLGRIGVTITCLSFLIIIYLHYYHIFFMPGMHPHQFNVLGYILMPDDASFVVFFVATAMILFICQIRKNTMLPYKIVKFHELILQLYNEKEYSEILSLVCDNLEWIKKEHEKNSKLGIKKGVVYQIIDMMCTDKNLIKAMAFNRHELALSIMDQKLGNYKKLADIYLCYLIKDKNSILYSELWGGRSDNKILIFLFVNCNVAIDLKVWRPIGEYVIEKLNELYIHKDMSSDVYNNSTKLYEEDVGERFMSESPLFTGVLFFDKMVHSALKQNIKEHMWLFYFRYFVNRILRNLSPNKDINMKDEFPTHYHRLLHEIVKRLSCWIHVVQNEIPLSQENINIGSEYLSYREIKNDIMEMAIATLGEVVHKITTCNESKIKNEFKFYIIEIVYNRYFELMKNDGTKRYARALINSVRRCRMMDDHEVQSTTLMYKKILLETTNKIVDNAVIERFIPELRKILQGDIDKHMKTNQYMDLIGQHNVE